MKLVADKWIEQLRRMLWPSELSHAQNLVSLPRRLWAHALALPGFVWMVVVLVAVLGLFIRSEVEPGRGDTYVIGAAQLSLEKVQGEASPVRLPHHLDNLDPTIQEVYRYELTWPEQLTYFDQLEKRLGMLIPRVGVRFRVLLNGVEIAEVGWRDPPKKSINSAYSPQLVPFPVGDLRSFGAHNSVVVEVKGQAMEGSGLSTVQMGDLQELKARYEVLHTWQVVLPWMMCAITAMVAMMAFLLYRHLRQTLLLYMGASASAYAVHLLLSGIWVPEFGYAEHFMANRISFSLYWVLLLLFSVEMINQRTTLTKTLAGAAAVIGPVWLLFTLSSASITSYRLWVVVLVALGFVVMGDAVARSIKSKRLKPNEWVVFTVLTFTLVVISRDFLVVYTPVQGDVDMKWLPLHAIGTICAYSWVLLERATDSAAAIKSHSEYVTKLAFEKDVQLKQQLAESQAYIKREAVESERRRAMRDLHDGLGSQINQITMYVRKHQKEIDPPQLLFMLQNAMHDLRMSLTGADVNVEGDLAVMLVGLRQKVQSMLSTAGLELIWQVRDVSPLPALNGSGMWHLNKCIQEAVTNTTKHAQAKTVTIKTSEDEDSVVLTVADDGVGLGNADVGMRGTSLGIKNMRVRAQKMGAKLEITTGANGGTRLDFIFDKHAVDAEDAVDTNGFGATIAPPDDEQLNALLAQMSNPKAQPPEKVAPDIELQ